MISLLAILLLWPSALIPWPAVSDEVLLPRPRPAAVPANTTTVTPDTKVIEFEGKRYTRRETQFDGKTSVTTIFFDAEGVPSGTDVEGLILNFYGWNPPIKPESVAQMMRSRQDGTQMVLGFQAPDSATQLPAFFLASQTPHADKGYGYINISKVASIADSAYAITYSRRITGGSGEAIGSNTQTWLASDYAKQTQKAIANLNITGDWKGSLAQQH